MCVFMLFPCLPPPPCRCTKQSDPVGEQVIGNESMAGMEDVLADPETEKAIAEFDFLVSETGEGAGEARSHGDGTEWGRCC